MKAASSNILQRNLEEENSLKEEELSDRVNKLKTIAIDIREYMNNEKSRLRKMDNDYDTSNDMIKNTLTKLNGIL
jgi:hypothetical protein